jgi:hypothetical protein
VLIRQGEGWRFGVDPGRHPFSVLLGGENWAVELRLLEAEALRDGALQLRSTLAALTDQLMPEECITLEWERDGLWLELEGCLGEASLRFVLQSHGDRSVEGGWSAAATTVLLAVLEQVNLPEA